MEAIITSLVNSALTSGTLSEVHILVGVFIISIIALRKINFDKSPRFDYDAINIKLEELQQNIDDLSFKSDISAKDLENIRADITDIKLKISEISAKMQL